jgi:hypothetical protein
MDGRTSVYATALMVTTAPNLALTGQSVNAAGDVVPSIAALHRDSRMGGTCQCANQLAIVAEPLSLRDRHG